jgi:hypothetical protein
MSGQPVWRLPHVESLDLHQCPGCLIQESRRDVVLELGAEHQEMFRSLLTRSHGDNLWSLGARCGNQVAVMMCWTFGVDIDDHGKAFQAQQLRRKAI